MLKYGILAKAVEWLCFKPSLTRLAELQPDMDMAVYKKKVQKEYREISILPMNWTGNLSTKGA